MSADKFNGLMALLGILGFFALIAFSAKSCSDYHRDPKVIEAEQTDDHKRIEAVRRAILQ